MTLTVLIVDDDQSKRDAVREALHAVVAAQEISICEAVDAISAKRLMMDNVFDLLVLDLALPLREPADPQPLGGVELLDEVIERDQYNIPPHIVGLTAHDDVYKQVETRFDSELWSLLFYERSSETWIDSLQAKVRHILRAKRSGGARYECDLAIVAALQDPELTAILALPWAWERWEVQADSTIYYRGEYLFEGQTRVAFAARAPNMGMPSATLLAAKMAFQFKPRCLVMPGICAGDGDEVELGDLIAANPAWDYGAGKFTDDAGVKRFDPNPNQVQLGTRVRGLVERLASTPMELEKIRQASPVKPTTALRLHIGALGSGAAVIGDADKFKEVKAFQRKTLGIDMEAYGVMLAAYELPAPTPDVLVLKGVSDFADREKNSTNALQIRPYAAYASAQAIGVLATVFGL
jgi:nucleoside phosphorylase